MNHSFIAITALVAAAATGTNAFAQEQGRVLSATPVVQQVAIPQQVCSNQMVYGQRQPSGAGAILGAVVGGLAGSAIGGGSGRAAATALGMFGGSIVGNNVEAGQPGYYPTRQCGTQTYYENRTVAYDVVYEYAGRRYSTRTQYNPGPWIPLTVQPATQGGGYGNYDPYGQQYQQQPPAQGYYGDNRYYDERNYQDNRYQNQGGYQDNPYQNNGYYDNRGYAQPGMVVSDQTGAYTAPVYDQSTDFRNSRGEPYRP